MRQSYIILFAIILMLISSTTIMAQAVTIQGKLTDDETGEPLIGATVLEKGTSNGTVTDYDGNYKLSVSSKDVTLVFSYVGYKQQETALNGRSVIDAALGLDLEELDEIVVIGYGTVRKSDLTGSVSTVKSEDLLKIPASNPMQALQGKAAGIQVTSTSGAPGAQPVVRVRGVGTFNNSSPIYVVDGVILNDISFLNSADIESMEILKDASATAIYGNRGANGVIMITTKQGKKGSGKLNLSVNAQYSVQNLQRKINLLDGPQFATVAHEINPAVFNYNNLSLLPNTDWQDKVFSPAPIYNAQIAVSGATERTTNYFSIGLYQKNGIVDKSDYKRVTLKMNNTFDVTKNFKLGNNVTVTPYQQRNAPDVTFQAYRAWPTVAPYYSSKDTSIPSLVGDYSAVQGVGNPMASLAYSNNYVNGLRGVGNFYAEGKILDAFTVKSSLALDGQMNRSKNFSPAFAVYNPDGTSSAQANQINDLTKTSSYNFTWIWTNTVNFNKEIGKHSINALAGYTMQRQMNESMTVVGSNIIRNGQDFWYIKPTNVYDPTNSVNNLQNISNTVDPNMNFSMISYLARLNYVYDNRYIFTATFRRDGSSKFSQKNRYGNFPSVAFGWNIINEAFMQNVPMLSNLKLRASAGIIGNDKIPYTGRFSTTENLVSVFGVNQSANAAVSYAKNGNPNLKWENTRQIDVGLEVGMFKDKLTAEFDYYRKDTRDILIQLSTPGYLGNGQGAKTYFNAAEVLNEGFEFNLIWKEEFKNGFNYSVGFLGSTIHNEVLSIQGSGADTVLLGGSVQGRYVTASRQGYPIGAFYGYQTNGIFQNQTQLDGYPHLSQAGVGDLIFKDTNGDGVLDSNDRTYLGSPIPKFIYGLNISVGYKNFDLSMNIQGQTGNKIFNGKEIVRPDPYNFEHHVINRWHGEGTSNTEPRASFGGYNYLPSSKYTYSGSYLRLRTLSIGYTIPDAMLSKMHLGSLRFYLTGNNLFTLMKFTGYSPEVASNDVIGNGIDMGSYPIPAIYSAGFNLTF